MQYIFVPTYLIAEVPPSRMVLTCRFYEQRFPEIDDVVMVNVRSIADMGAYVHLLEYNNIEGMILLSELSRRRIRYCRLMSLGIVVTSIHYYQGPSIN